MGIMLKIAVRNVIRHKGKSLVIGVILFIGGFFLSLGTSVISSMDKGFDKNIIEGYSGHIAIASTNLEFDNILTPSFGDDIEPLTSSYSNIKSLLSNSALVADFTPICIGNVTVLNEGGSMFRGRALGVKPLEYMRFTKTNMKIVSGRMLKEGERGVLVSTYNRGNYFRRSSGLWPLPPGEDFAATNVLNETVDVDRLRSIARFKQDYIERRPELVKGSDDKEETLNNPKELAAIKEIHKAIDIIERYKYKEAGAILKGIDPSLKAGKIAKQIMRQISIKGVKKRVDVQSNVVLEGSSGSVSLDIRSDVVGVFEFNSLKRQTRWYNIMDVKSFRECLGYFSGVDPSAKVSDSELETLAMDESDIEAMFSSGSIIGAEAEDPISSSGPSLEEVLNAEPEDVDAGTYNAVLVKLKDGVNLHQAQKELQALFKEAKADAWVLRWDQALGQIADMAALMRGIVYGFIIFIFIVASIIIMNTLTMTALERISEIGMMRAIGAKKRFVGTMFFAETAMLSAIFGSAGIAVGAVVSQVFTALKVSADGNGMLEILFGGEQLFAPALSPADLLFCFTALAVVTIIAAVYPVIIAGRISPFEAITRD